LTIRCGKENKVHGIPLNADTTRAVGCWLRLRGRRNGALFCRIDKWDNLDSQWHGLSPHALYKMLLKRAAEVGFAHASPHDFRRTAIGDIFDAGHDLATAQQLAGHTSPVTTTATSAAATAPERGPPPTSTSLYPTDATKTRTLAETASNRYGAKLPTSFCLADVDIGSQGICRSFFR
jgi:integrase